MDSSVTVQQAKLQVLEFRKSKNWLKYDSPKNLAISITVEAAELLDHFQWQTDQEIQEGLKNPLKMEKIRDELADVFIACLAFSDVMKIDLIDVMKRKILEYDQKHPTSKPAITAYD